MFEKIWTLDAGSYQIRLYDPLTKTHFAIRTVLGKEGSGYIKGEEAFSLFWQKGPDALIYPVDHERISKKAFVLIEDMVKNQDLSHHMLKPTLRILLPADLMHTNREDWQKLALDAGFRRVVFCDPLSLMKAENHMIIHAGHSCTRLVIYGSRSILREETIIFGGKAMDEAIMDYIARTYRALMFHEDANALKHAASNAFWQNKNPTLSCTVLDQHNQFIRISFPASDLWPAMQSVLDQIVLWASEMLAGLGLEKMETILSHPILLYGGLSQCYGLSQLLEQQLHAKVVIPHENPQDLSSVQKGILF